MNKTSTSSIPTRENYGPLLPISTYGATKLGCEALAASNTQLPLQVTIFRFANVVGPRAGHEVIYDFIKKLQQNPKGLEVLGGWDTNEVLSLHRRLYRQSKMDSGMAQLGPTTACGVRVSGGLSVQCFAEGLSVVLVPVDLEPS